MTSGIIHHAIFARLCATSSVLSQVAWAFVKTKNQSERAPCEILENEEHAFSYLTKRR